MLLRFRFGQRPDARYQSGTVGRQHRRGDEEPRSRSRQQNFRTDRRRSSCKMGQGAERHRSRRQRRPTGNALYVALPHTDQPVGLHGRGRPVPRPRPEHPQGRRLYQLHHLLAVGYVPRPDAPLQHHQPRTQHRHGRIDAEALRAEHPPRTAGMVAHGQ